MTSSIANETTTPSEPDSGSRFYADAVGLESRPEQRRARSVPHSATGEHLVAAWLDWESAASRPLADEPLWRRYVQRRFNDVSLGDPATAPSRDTLWSAWWLVERLLDPATPTPSVVPGEAGAVELVWQRAGWYIVLEIGPNASYIWANHADSGDRFSGDLDDIHEPVRELLADLARRR